MTPDVRWTGPLDALDVTDWSALVEREGTVSAEIQAQVAEMADRIQAEGDEALIAYTERFDDVKLEQLRVPPEAFESALDEAPAGFVDAMERACAQIRGYHDAQAGTPEANFQANGVQARERRVALKRVGIYVPGGRAAYPSTVAMTVLPAQRAGVEDIVVASPPGPNGLPHPLVLATCQLLGVDHVVPLGGAQAILALALGTESIPPCDGVVGPGNAHVQAAKQHIAGQVRIDSPAGPSEVAVLVGPEADPATAALELAAQAEHDPASLVVALCLGDGTEAAVLDALDELLPTLPRREIIQAALANQGAVLTVDDVDEATGLLDELAPEHCVLLHTDSPAIAATLTGPACIVAGSRARVAITDYIAGPSHVLPTGGAARAFSGIDVDTFTKRVHIALLDDVAEPLLQAGAQLARLEGLEAHARAIEHQEGDQ